MKQSFSAKLQSIGPSGAWTLLRLPFDVEKAFGTRARLAVKGTINGHQFRSSIFPDGKGGHTMMVNKAMQAGAGAKPGQAVRVVLEPDQAPRQVEPPTDLQKLLKKNSKAGKFFAGLAPSYRKGYVEWIESAKQEATRKRRLEKTVAALEAGKKEIH